jgi:nucleoside-diphosphate-sugar epimerase
MSLSLLITGGSGYLGQFLIEGLKDQYRASENSEIESLDMRQGSIEIPKANSPFK